MRQSQSCQKGLVVLLRLNSMRAPEVAPDTLSCDSAMNLVFMLSR